MLDYLPLFRNETPMRSRIKRNTTAATPASAPNILLDLPFSSAIIVVSWEICKHINIRIYVCLFEH